MVDYTKLKNAELESKLKELGLPHTGKKADLVKRLEDHDAQSGGTKTTTKVSDKEDEIDWDDEPTSKEATKKPNDAPGKNDPSNAAQTNAGTGRATNPQAVPNQSKAIDPSTTRDLNASKSSSASTKPSATESTSSDAKKETASASAFSSGLAPATADEELAKRKARAAKFGTVLPDVKTATSQATSTVVASAGADADDAEKHKARERAAKFGTVLPDASANTAKQSTGADKIVHGLNVSLDDLATKKGKRGRDAKTGGEKVDKVSAASNKEQAPKRQKVENGPAKPSAAGAGISEADRLKAEARRAKFGGA